VESHVILGSGYKNHNTILSIDSLD